MDFEKNPSKLSSMMNMKLTVGQVLAGSFTTVVTVVTIVIYIQGTFETKLDADRKDIQIQARINKVEDGFQAQSKLQTEIYGDVKKISGILESQMAEKAGRK